MPFQEFDRRYRVQAAVLWAAVSPVSYDRYGQTLVSAPVEIKVRWLTCRREVLDSKGNTIALDAEAVVGQQIPVGSRMWFGSLSSWAGTGSGLPDKEVHEVKVYHETPDVKGRAVRRTVGLMRWHD